MPKTIKGNPRRKPPPPTPDHAVIEAWTGQVAPAVQPLVAAVDRVVCAAVPDLQYAVKFHRAFYGLTEHGWLIEVAAYFTSVNVLFLGGADFEAPPPLGSTGRTRYVKLTSVEEADREDLRTWIRTSARTAGWQ